MSESHNPNYRETYFQHPTLTKIHGDPTYTGLAKLEREIKANGKSAPSTLGGGSQGHLGLVSSPQSYDRVSPGVPFTRPVLLVLLNLANSTANQIAVAEEAYTKTLHAFKTCNILERTIIQQVNTALDADCLTDLIDDETGLLEGPVHHIMSHLFETYGAITPQTLTSAKAALETTTYNHSKPITNVFTAINDYATMADAANSAENPTQLINIGLIIITRSTLFASDIRRWHGRAAPEKTWAAFKTHFKDAQREIKRSQPAVTTDSLGYHHVNAATIVDQVIEHLTTEQMQHDSEQQDAANATQQEGMMEQMQHLMTTISDLQTQVTNNNNNRNNSNSNGNGNSNNNGNGINGSSNGNNNNARGHNYGYQGRNPRGYQGRNSGQQRQAQQCQRPLVHSTSTR
jgi:hypothetical protein